MHRECGDLLYVKKLPPKPEGAVYKSCVRPAIPYEKEIWCMKENKMAERSTVREMREIQPNIEGP